MDNSNKKTFTPHQPEKKVTVTITRREAVLLTRLRKITYGKILIHKAEDMIIRIEPTVSELVNPKDDIDLE